MPFFRQPRSVLFQEVDAAGIVFFARFFDWFHDAYIAAAEARGVRFDKVLADGVWGAPLVHAEADYREPLSYAERVTVDVESVDLGETSMTIAYTVRGEDGTRVHATGRTIHVFIDRTTFRPRPVPDEVRAAFG